MNTTAKQIFDAEQARLAAAAHLPPTLFVEFQRLAKTLIHGPSFQLLIVDCRDERLRSRVLTSLGELERQAGLRGIEVGLDAPVAGDVSALETRLIESARDHDVIHLLGASVWMDDVAWQSFNLVRERLATQARVRLVFWLNEASIARIARNAADIWAWRGGIYSFLEGNQSLEVGDLQRHAKVSANQIRAAFDSRSMKERYQRIAEIRSMLDSVPTPSDDFRAPLLEEIAYIQKNFGNNQKVIDLVEEEMLPLADRLADHRLLAEAWTYWADAKNSLGDLDSALQAYREKILPIQVSRSDEREVAIVQGRIADVLQDRGNLDESLRIRREEQLPVYENLSDIRSRALTMGRIADVLQAKGDLEEALRIRREEELPVYEKLGDVRECAVTTGKIADVLRARGDLEEALRIRREEELPVYEKLGDVRELLVGRTNLAINLKQRGRAEDGPEIERLLRLAYSEAQRLGLPEARQIEEIFEEFLGMKIGRG